jgi:hypothetical protein
MMLKFLCFPLALSTTIISSLSFFPNAGIAQEDPLCFMVNSSGQVVSLNNLCDAQNRSAKKASVCEGPFDKDGFPLALSSDLARFNAAVAKAKQNKASNSKDSEEQSAMAYDDPEVQSAMENLMNNMMNKIPSYARMQEIEKKYSDSYSQSGSVNREETEKFEAEYNKVLREMSTDSCYTNIMQAFSTKMADLEKF